MTGKVGSQDGYANASITVTPYSVTYDSSSHTATGTASGVFNESLSSGLTLSGTTHTSAGTYNGDGWSFHDNAGNYNDASGSVNDVIAKANATVVVTPYSVTYDSTAHTATYTIKGVGSDTGAAGSSVTLSSMHSQAGTYSDSWSFSGGNNYNDIASTAITDVISQRQLFVTANNNSKPFGQTATETGTVTGVQGSDGITATFSSAGDVASAPVGTYPVTATLSDPNHKLSNYSVHETDATLTVSNLAPASAYVLDPTASGAVTASGNAIVSLKNGLYVDSTSPSAILASGNVQVNVGNNVYVAGGVSKNGSAAVGTINPWSVSSDPLAGLTAPSLAGLTNYGAVSVSGKATATLNPGIYTSIQISGQAVVTMNPGIYIIKGGGFTVTGGASVVTGPNNANGDGVFIFNAGSAYTNDGVNPPTDGGNFGGITLSGSGTFNLHPMSTGQYASILIYQSRTNTRALSITGNATTNVNGTIYAAKAMLNISGNGTLNDTLVVDTLNVSGNAALTQMAAGSDGAGDQMGIADTLLAGNLNVYVDNSSGYFTADMLARIEDAITGVDALLVPYNVTITEVSDPSLANVIIDANTTSASGDMAHGVLGCYNPTVSPIEITMIEGWDWYAGSDPSQISAGQYDFQTTVTHEFGHALGLGGSLSATSPMNETLPTGTVRRNMTTPDLNIPYPPEGADPQMAAGFAEPQQDTPATALPPAHEAIISSSHESQPTTFHTAIALSTGQTLPAAALHASLPNATVAAVLPSVSPTNASGLASPSLSVGRDRDGDTSSGSVEHALRNTADQVFAQLTQGPETPSGATDQAGPGALPANAAAVQADMDQRVPGAALAGLSAAESLFVPEPALADACFAGDAWSPRSMNVLEDSVLVAMLAVSPAMLREWASGSAGADEEEEPRLGGARR